MKKVNNMSLKKGQSRFTYLGDLTGLTGPGDGEAGRTGGCMWAPRKGFPVRYPASGNDRSKLTGGDSNALFEKSMNGWQ